MSVADRDAVGSLWKAIIGELQHRTLGFWSKAIPSTVDNFSFWETTFGRLLGPSRDWTLNHRPPSLPCTWTAHHELDIIWPQAIKLYTPSANGSSIYEIGLAQLWRHYKVTKGSNPNAHGPIPATLPSISQPAPMNSWGVPYNQLTEEEKTQAWFVDGFAQCVGTTPKVDSCSTIAPFWDILEGQCWREILQRAELQAVHLVVHLLRKRNDQMCNYIPVRELWPVVWLGGQGFGGNMIRK